MRAQRGIGGVAAAVLVLAASLIGSGPAWSASAEVPFKATAQGQIAFTGETTLAWSGAGRALQMGEVTGAGNITLTGGDDSCPGGLANTHVATVTAANGATLTFTQTDVSCPVSPSVFHGTGHWTVTSGTGRFAGVTGHGSVVGDANLATGAFTISWTGELVL